jgi:zinc transport system substrate-binding protein
MLLRALLFCLCLAPVAAFAAPRVFVTVAPLAWLVEQVGGPDVEVRSLVRPGQDPHGFEPSPRQLGALQDADAYLSLGLPFEQAWLPRMAALHPRLRVVELLAVDGTAAGHQDAGHNHRHGTIDPHVWTDPLRMLALSELVRDLLAELQPATQASYAQRQHEVAQRLRALHAELETRFAAMPRQVFLVHHPAWGHLAARYGLNQLAIERDGKEPGPQALAALAAQVRQQGIHTLFVEPQMSDHLAHGLADTLGLEIQVLDPLAGDYPENLRRVAQQIVEGSR